ncbi:sensor histidine kinase [Rhizobium sp. YIM 134829]|uniref:sensor histidine kinase n=1 Tax=Rhizobium sp. YIM 134829 TaxID=3390453 RepID=UPI00397C12CD
MTPVRSSLLSSSRSADETISLLDLVLRKTGTGYLVQSPELDTLKSGNLPGVLSPLVERDGDERVFGQSAPALRTLKQQVLSSGEPETTELDLPSPTGLLTFKIDLERIPSASGDALLTVITDVSETRHRERVLKTLLRELSHRSKNLLAIIQGIATQTARQAFSLDSFLVKFRGRIQSLASSQDLVTESSWRGAFLFELVEKQVAPYWHGTTLPIAMTGINAHLSPNAALHIGLAMHELIVNSASHGVLAIGMEGLKLDCVEIEHEERRVLELTWAETLPAHREGAEGEEPGFARTVLERVVPIAIGGTAHYVLTAERVDYRLTIPAHEYEIITLAEE